MSLLAMQTAFARVCTDAAYRSQLVDKPDGACAQLDLTGAEADWLANLDKKQLERFARSLHQKRRASARTHAAATFALLGEAADDLFQTYAETHRWLGASALDARGFLRFVQGRVGGNGPLIVDVTRCEAAMVEITLALHGEPASEPVPTLGSSMRVRRTSRMAVCHVDFDLETLYPSLAQGRKLAADAHPCSVLIGRARGATVSRVKRINRATACLLDLCDGSRPVEQVLQEGSRRFAVQPEAVPHFIAEARALMQQLLSDGLLAAI